MLDKLFFKLLPLQILIVAMGSINSIVDGVVAGRGIDAASVGVIGLFYTEVQILTAIGSMLLGGTSVLCGRYMGSGDLAKTRGIFSLNLTITFLVGAAITLVNLLLTRPLAVALGANDSLIPALSGYIIGYAVGIIPQLLAQQLSMFLQLERQSGRGTIGVVVMIISNITLDILFVFVLHLGTLGLALATGISNWAYFLVLLPYYFTKKAQLRLSFKGILWRKLPSMLKIGFPGALLVFCLGIRTLILNRLLLTYGGDDGLSAMSAFTMVLGLEISFCLGIGAVVRMMASVSIGEEDRLGLKNVLHTALTKGFLFSVIVAVVMLILSSPLAQLFFSDTNSQVYQMARQLFLIYACCIPLVLVIQVFSNYLQATGHNVFVNILSVFDGLLAMVIPALILTPVLGVLGVWVSNPIGIVLTALAIVVYAWIYQRHFPKSLDDYLFVPADFGVMGEDGKKVRLDFYIRSGEEVTETAEKVQSFCDKEGIDGKRGMYAALSLEEMAVNIVKHGFQADQKSHSIQVSVVKTEESLLLRLKDDCIPFDPKERADQLGGSDPTKNIGLRIVTGLADEMVYQNLLGLNVLSIRFLNEEKEAV